MAMLLPILHDLTPQRTAGKGELLSNTHGPQPHSRLGQAFAKAAREAAVQNCCSQASWTAVGSIDALAQLYWTDYHRPDVAELMA
jgi:hypothetical protein